MTEWQAMGRIMPSTWSTTSRHQAKRCFLVLVACWSVAPTSECSVCRCRCALSSSSCSPLRMTTAKEDTTSVVLSSGIMAAVGPTVSRQCAGCRRDIRDRYLLHAIGLYWHTGCLRCSICHSELAELSSTCYTRAGLILCRQDYIR